MFNIFIKKYPFFRREKDFGKGLLDRPSDIPDYRDYKAEEIATFAPVIWKEKKPEDFKTYPIKNQNGSGSCVGQTISKQLEVDELNENKVYRKLSARSIYSLGYVSTGGMNMRDATKIAIEKGATLEYLLPSENKNEQEMRYNGDYNTDAKQIALVYKPKMALFVEPSLENIVSVIQEHRDKGIEKAVGICVKGYNNGTWLSVYPKPIVKGEPWYHAITALDFGLIKGKKYISIDNSWGDIAMEGKQFLSIDYEPFIYSAEYFLNLPDDWRDKVSEIKKPKYQWTKLMKIGSKGDDVLALQKALQHLGMFPVDICVKPTGAFFGISRNGVQIFQRVYKLKVDGIVGKNTLKKLNEIFK